jgi:hypothetical protein
MRLAICKAAGHRGCCNCASSCAAHRNTTVGCTEPCSCIAELHQQYAGAGMRQQYAGAGDAGPGRLQQALLLLAFLWRAQPKRTAGQGRVRARLPWRTCRALFASASRLHASKAAKGAPRTQLGGAELADCWVLHGCMAVLAGTNSAGSGLAHEAHQAGGGTTTAGRETCGSPGEHWRQLECALAVAVHQEDVVCSSLEHSGQLLGPDVNLGTPQQHRHVVGRQAGRRVLA